MVNAWNKGQTKYTHPSVKKISVTMRAGGIDNFARWREQARSTGIIPKTYPSFVRNGDLAELMGVVLGDGNIQQFPRTEALRIVGNARHTGFITRYTKIIERVFGKKPHVAKRKDADAVNITLYQKYISKRLGLPTGAKRNLRVKVPKWILDDSKYTCRYLRGLYESDGSHSIHKPTYTYKLFFTNKNESLLQIVFDLVKGLGFHPHMSRDNVQVSRKSEVQKLKDLLQFRRY
jgi:hypothetical protein